MIELDRIQEAFSSIYWRWLFFESDQVPATLIELLSKNLSHIDPSTWGSRLSWGGAFINGIAALADTALTTPCKIEYYEPKFPIEGAGEYFAPFDPRYVVFQDEEILVVFKPPRLPSMPAKEQRIFNLKSYIEEYIGRTVHMPSRLDMSTQGLVIVSSAPDMHDRLQKLFQDRAISKSYLFETDRTVPKEEFRCDGPIGKTPLHPVLREVALEGGKSASTLFFRRSPIFNSEDVSAPKTTLVEARPLSGRTHQIRVHASHLGIPIVGDNFYGGSRSSGLRLLSFRLSFVHPRTSLPLDIVLPRPLWPDWALPAFEICSESR